MHYPQVSTSLAHIYETSPWSQHPVRHNSGQDRLEQDVEAQTFCRLQVVENERGGFVSLWRLESDFLCGYDWESRGTHREPASVWRCQMTGLASNSLLLNSTLKWPLIELQTCLLWSVLLCKPLLDGGTLACEHMAESEHECKYYHGPAFPCWITAQKR